MNKKEIEIISFCGPIGSGKDYQSELLVKQKYTKIAFADPLRKLIWDTLDWKPAGELEYSLFKETYFNALPKKIPAFTGRDILQNLGEGAKNLFGKTCWVNAWEELLQNEYIKNNTKQFVVSDVRFKQEILRLFEYNTKIIFCNYKSSRYYVKNNTSSEALAYELVHGGFKDGDDITNYLKEKYL
jgi:hypothetical protein